MRLTTVFVLGLCLLGVSTTADAQEMTRAEWIALRQTKFAVPEGQRPFPLLRQMNALLGSPDPMLRDGVGYEAAEQWIIRKPALTVDEQRQLLEMWSANLRTPGDGDAVLLRSFSALNLSLLAARDIAQPFLTQPEFDRFVSDILEYLGRERDTRGYDVSKGWFHTAAHTADVLKFLARSPKLSAATAGRMLSAIESKCVRFGQVFQWAEDERLAQVIVSLARRPGFDIDAFRSWLQAIEPRRASVWSAAPAIDPVKYAELQNLKLVLRSAYVALATDADSTPGQKSAAVLLTTLKALR